MCLRRVWHCSQYLHSTGAVRIDSISSCRVWRNSRCWSWPEIDIGLILIFAVARPQDACDFQSCVLHSVITRPQPNKCKLRENSAALRSREAEKNLIPNWVSLALNSSPECDRGKLETIKFSDASRNVRGPSLRSGKKR